jgi:cytochrome c5
MENFMKVNCKIKTVSIPWLLVALGLSVMSNRAISEPLDTVLYEKAQNPANLTSGQVVFEQACAACHGKALGGGAGFNLKDGEWVHGEAPSAILDNIKKGFNSAGMPAFGNIYSDSQLQDVVAYILSKREGMSNLSYKVYALKDRGDTQLSADNLVKSGMLPRNLMNFELPETEYYAIEFEGDLYAPNTPSKLFIDGFIPTPLKVEIDGEEIKRTSRSAIWPLKPGKQRLNFQFIVNAPVKQDWKKNLALFVTNDDLEIKLFSLSTRGQLLMDDKKVHVEATNKVKVQRKKIRGLPTYSVSVGFPQKINYAFNTRSCNIVGLWSGDLLNVGPNVEGRGKDSSLILGDWLIKDDQAFGFLAESNCNYQKLVKSDGPSFFFSATGIDYRLTTKEESASGITFVYQVLNNPNKQASKLTLPSNTQLAISTSAGQITDNALVVAPEHQTFTIRLAKK